MAATTASCVVINTLDQLESYEFIWRELFGQTSQPSAFASWEWLYNWWRYFGANAATRDESGRSFLLLIQAYDVDNQLIGLVPMYYAFQSGGRTRIPVLRMVGDLEPGVENPTEEPVVVLKRGHEREAIAAVHGFLRYQPGNSDWSYASLAVPYALPGAASSETERKTSDFLALRRVSTVEMLELPDSWGEFRKSLSKSMRDNLKYYPRLIERHGHVASIRVARTADEVYAAAATLTHLHRRRNACSRGTPHGNHLPSETHKSFLADCLSALAKRGMASIYTLEIDGKPVAAQSVLEGPEGLCIYYSGFEPDWHMYSPITILATEILQDAIKRDVQQVNFLGESKSWKVRWGTKPVERYSRLVRIRWHFPSLLRCAAFHCSATYSNRFTVVFEKQPSVVNIREAISPRSTT